jgi:hypothetical protein
VKTNKVILILIVLVLFYIFIYPGIYLPSGNWANSSIKTRTNIITGNIQFYVMQEDGDWGWEDKDDWLGGE